MPSLSNILLIPSFLLSAVEYAALIKDTLLEYANNSKAALKDIANITFRPFILLI